MRAIIVLASVAAVLLVCGCNAFDQSSNFATCDKIKMKPAELDECLYNTSIRKTDSVMCADILNETMKMNCITQISMSLLDYMPCKQQDTPKHKDECEAKVSEVRKKYREQNPTAHLP